MLNTFLAEQAQKQARLKLQRAEKNRQTEDIAIQCTRSPQTVEVAVQTDIPDIMEELRDQVKSLTKIVAELTEMKAREKVTCLPVFSDSDLTFINQDEDNVVEETPPQARPAAITSAIIVPEPQVPQPLSAPCHSPPILHLRFGLLCPLSIAIHKFSAASRALDLQTSRSRKWRPLSSWAKKWYPLPWRASMHYSLTKSWLIATRLEVADIENLVI